jgi:hypothetical protein
MTGRKHSILKILSAAAMWALMLPRIAVGEFGVCPPYSKTFGPEDPPEEVLAFIEEINLRPGGGTLVLEPGDHADGWYLGEISITGVVCIRSSEPDSIAHTNYLDTYVASGATFTAKSLHLGGVEVAAGATLFGEKTFAWPFVIHGTAYLVDFEAERWENFGTLIWRGGSMADEVGFYGEPVFQNHGWALLDRVGISAWPQYHHDIVPGFAIANTDGGVLTLVQTTIEELSTHGVPAGGISNGPGSSVYLTASTIVGDNWPVIDNEGHLEIAQSVVDGDCAGAPVTDTGYNVIGDSSCTITEPTSVQADPLFMPDSLELAAGSPAIDRIPLGLCSETDMLGRARTDGDNDGVIACDSGALEYGYASVPVTVRTTPYWRETGTLDLRRDAALFVSVFSTAAFDATSILFDTIDVEGLDEYALRGPALIDANRDGYLDIAVWYRLDRMPPLDCGSYDQRFEAMIEDGRMVTGQLRFEVVGCSP